MLYFNMADSLKRQLQRVGQVRVSIQADFTAITDADCFVRLNVYCHNKRKKQLQRQVIPLNSGTLVEQLLQVPSQTHFISMSLSADQTTRFALKQVKLDNKSLPLSTFSFHNWEPANAVINGVYQATYLPEQIVVQRQ